MPSRLPVRQNFDKSHHHWSGQGLCALGPARRKRKRKSVTAAVRPQILEALNGLPRELRERSGAVFYSGRDAFSEDRPIYILGLNPGGTPREQEAETVERDLSTWSEMPGRSSRYLDESWQGKVPGTHGLQPRMRHMFDRLGVDLRQTPASNLVFARSTSEADLAAEKERLIETCWPVHQAVIDSLDIQTVLCLGGTAGRWVREVIGANKRVDSFLETNARGWTSEAQRPHSWNITTDTASSQESSMGVPRNGFFPDVQRVLLSRRLELCCGAHKLRMHERNGIQKTVNAMQLAALSRRA